MTYPRVKAPRQLPPRTRQHRIARADALFGATEALAA
jgi:hypothetical protein